MFNAIKNHNENCTSIRNKTGVWNDGIFRGQYWNAEEIAAMINTQTYIQAYIVIHIRENAQTHNYSDAVMYLCVYPKWGCCIVHIFSSIHAYTNTNTSVRKQTDKNTRAYTKKLNIWKLIDYISITEKKFENKR